MTKTSLFDIIPMELYHRELFKTWMRLIKDGIVKKDNEDMFVEYGKKFTTYIMANRIIPDYREVLVFIPEIIESLNKYSNV